MSINTGTLISAAIRPNDSLDLIASAHDNELKGTVHSYTTTAARDAIIEARRSWGMLCAVTNDGGSTGTYQLKYGQNSTTITDNANWVSFSGSYLSSLSDLYLPIYSSDTTALRNSSLQEFESNLWISSGNVGIGGSSVRRPDAMLEVESDLHVGTTATIGSDLFLNNLGTGFLSVDATHKVYVSAGSGGGVNPTTTRVPVKQDTTFNDSVITSTVFSEAHITPFQSNANRLGVDGWIDLRSSVNNEGDWEDSTTSINSYLGLAVNSTSSRGGINYGASTTYDTTTYPHVSLADTAWNYRGNPGCAGMYLYGRGSPTTPDRLQFFSGDSFSFVGLYGSPRVVIAGNGNVGIGGPSVDTPDAMLEVESDLHVGTNATIGSDLFLNNLGTGFLSVDATHKVYVSAGPTLSGLTNYKVPVYNSGTGLLVNSNAESDYSGAGSNFSINGNLLVKYAASPTNYVTLAANNFGGLNITPLGGITVIGPAARIFTDQNTTLEVQSSTTGPENAAISIACTYNSSLTPSFIFYKIRGTGAVINGDWLGQFRTYAYDGVSNLSCGYTGWVVSDTVGTSDIATDYQIATRSTRTSGIQEHVVAQFTQDAKFYLYHDDDPTKNGYITYDLLYGTTYGFRSTSELLVDGGGLGQVNNNGGFWTKSTETIQDEGTLALSTFLPNGTEEGCLWITVAYNGYTPVTYLGGMVHIAGANNVVTIVLNSPTSTLSSSDSDGFLCILANGDGTYTLKNRLNLYGLRFRIAFIGVI